MTTDLIDSHIHVTACIIVRRTTIPSWAGKTLDQQAAEVADLIREGIVAKASMARPVDCTACDDTRKAGCRSCGGTGGEATKCGDCGGKGEVRCCECREDAEWERGE